tara:strand:+ start:214 stop:549 length:336 start_codon:yes stop_codon:yes gene_type:complete
MYKESQCRDRKMYMCLQGLSWNVGDVVMRLADGYEDAFIGTTISAFSRKQVAVYDYDKCLLILINKYGLDDETAMEWFSFNVLGSWVGDDTPIFINQHKIKNIEEYLDDED